MPPKSSARSLLTSSHKATNSFDGSPKVDRKKIHHLGKKVSISKSEGVHIQDPESTNILELHSILLAIFDGAEEDIEEINSRIATIEAYLAVSQPVNTMFDLLNELDRLEEERELLQKNEKMLRYIDNCSSLLKQYEQVKAAEVPKVFGKKEKPNQEILQQKAELTDAYLRKVNATLTRVYYTKQHAPTCPKCAGEMASSQMESEEVGSGNTECRECGYITDIYSLDISTTPTAKKKASRRQDGCTTTMKTLEGTVIFSGNLDNIITALDEYFEAEGELSGAKAKKKPLIDGVRKGTSREKLLTAMKEIGMSRIERDCNFLAALYWGWELPKLEKVERQLREQYAQLQQTYLQENSSPLNPSWLLRKLLEDMHNLHYNTEMYRQISEESVARYEKEYSKCKKLLEW